MENTFFYWKKFNHRKEKLGFTGFGNYLNNPCIAKSLYDVYNLLHKIVNTWENENCVSVIEIQASNKK